MVNIAIAGGNGAIGQTTVEVLDESKTTHKLLILSRKPPANEREIQADYKDIDGIVKVLEHNDIHTVICTFGITGDSLEVSQLNLIKAAEKSRTTKRFIPSVFAIEYPREGVEILPPLKHHFTCLDALAESSLEWTVIINGIFLDYFGMPHIKSHLSPDTIAIDVQHRKAAIPGDGKVPVTFTYSFDVARFVVALLDLPKWPKESKIIGQTLTWNELLRTAEEVTGQKFDVTYDPIEKLKRFEVTELPGHVALYDKFPKDRLQWFLSIFELWTTDGTSEVKKEGSLNEKFPDIKPVGVRELLEKAWGRK